MDCRAALMSDPFCYEAYHALMQNHMLSNDQELELLESLEMKAEDRWLSLLYLTMCKKVCTDCFGQSTPMWGRSYLST